MEFKSIFLKYTVYTFNGTNNKAHDKKRKHINEKQVCVLNMQYVLVSDQNVFITQKIEIELKFQVGPTWNWISEQICNLWQNSLWFKNKWYWNFANTDIIRKGFSAL